MVLHLKKLSVGSDDLASLAAWHQEVLAKHNRIMHVTRSFPRRADEILQGGSIYWVIKGKFCARQIIEDLVRIKREDGGHSCGIVLRDGLIPVFAKRHRPFQGWRYLENEDAPTDLPEGANIDDVMPQEMAEELQNLGLL